MNRRTRQATHFTHNFLSLQLFGPFQRTPPQKLCQRRSAGDRRHASFGKEPYFGNTAIDDPQSKFQNVSTGRIFQLHGSIGVSYFSRIPGMLEVVKKPRRIHRGIVARDDCARVLAEVSKRFLKWREPNEPRPAVTGLTM